MDRAARGAAGEHLAAEWYKKEGYTLLCKNWRTRQGEVDLILKRDALYVFAEVKTRAPNGWDRPAAAVNAKKQRRLMLAALAYLARHGLSDPPMRFDVVEVVASGDGRPEINVIENAFTA